MTLVILLYPDGQRREVILAGVPRTGETIRLKNDRTVLVIEHVLWMESSNGAEPAVLVSVRPSALHTSGAVYTYTGTYTVQNGIIVAAQIAQD